MNDWIALIWHFVVIGLGIWSLVKGVGEFKSGRAKIPSWPAFVRVVTPLEYWLEITGRLLGIVGAIALVIAFRVWS